jgi:hypothetical protein
MVAAGLDVTCAGGGDRGALLSRPVWRALLGEGAGAFQEVI